MAPKSPKKSPPTQHTKRAATTKRKLNANAKPSPPTSVHPPHPPTATVHSSNGKMVIYGSSNVIKRKYSHPDSANLAAAVKFYRDKLKEKKKKARWSKTAVAEKFGIPRSTFSNYVHKNPAKRLQVASLSS